MQKLGKFTERPVALLEYVGEWQMAPRRMSPGMSRRSAPLREAEAAGNFRHGHHVGIGVAQLTADFLQPTQQQILGRAHAEKFGTAQAKGLVADRDQRAQFRHPQRPAEMLRQDLLEPDHDPGMTALGVVVGPRWRSSNR